MYDRKACSRPSKPLTRASWSRGKRNRDRDALEPSILAPPGGPTDPWLWLTGRVGTIRTDEAPRWDLLHQPDQLHAIAEGPGGIHAGLVDVIGDEGLPVGGDDEQSSLSRKICDRPHEAK